MATGRATAAEQFRRVIKWIALASVLMVIAALAYLRWADAWSAHAVIATVLGVLFSVLLGSGLFALAFFSAKSGHDENVTNATSRRNQDDG